MKRTVSILSVLSLAFAIAATSFAQTPSTPQSKPEHLSKQQLNALIATASTPSEHLRIAQYYKAKAQEYLTEAQEHEAMIAAYKSNSSISNDKNWASTIGHCEYFVKTFNALADNSEEMATLHERMAQEAPVKLPQTGK